MQGELSADRTVAGRRRFGARKSRGAVWVRNLPRIPDIFADMQKARVAVCQQDCDEEDIDTDAIRQTYAETINRKATRMTARRSSTMPAWW